MPPEAVQLGLDGVKRIEFVWGFQDDALRSVLRAVAPSPRRGLLALVDQPTFTIDALPPLPPELTGFTVFSIDLAKTYDKVLEIVKTTPTRDGRPDPRHRRGDRAAARRERPQ